MEGECWEVAECVSRTKSSSQLSASFKADASLHLHLMNYSLILICFAPPSSHLLQPYNFLLLSPFEASDPNTDRNPLYKDFNFYFSPHPLIPTKWQPHPFSFLEHRSHNYNFLHSLIWKLLFYTYSPIPIFP